MNRMIVFFLFCFSFLIERKFSFVHLYLQGSVVSMCVTVVTSRGETFLIFLKVDSGLKAINKNDDV